MRCTEVKSRGNLDKQKGSRFEGIVTIEAQIDVDCVGIPLPGPFFRTAQAFSPQKLPSLPEKVPTP